MEEVTKHYVVQNIAYAVNKMLKQNKILFILVLVMISILTITIVSAQFCDVENVRDNLAKALFDYFHSPNSGRYNKTELKDLLNFYLDSENSTTVRCDVKATVSNVNYDTIISRFSNASKDVTFPSCSDGTPYGKCSSTKPLFCFAGQLVNRCRLCGCSSSDFTCQLNETSASVINEGKWGKCVSKKCTDGTLYNNCSITKPLFCSNGTLSNNCNSCGCPAEQMCQANGTCIAKDITTLSDIDGDGINETLVNTKVVGTGNISNNIIYLPTFESVIREDLNGDGDTQDIVLRYYNINTGRLVNTGIKINLDSGTSDAAASNSIIAFTNNGLLGYYDINTGKIVNTGINIGGEVISISNNIIAFTNRSLLEYYDINTDRLVNTGINISNWRVFISNNIIAFTNRSLLEYYDINTDRLVNTGITISNWPVLSISNNIIAFTNRSLLEYYDINTDRLVNTKVIGGYVSNGVGISNNIIAFANYSFQIMYYDINTDRLVNTKVIGGGVGISNNIISFSTFESVIREDLNGDGDTQDIVLRYITLSKYKNGGNNITIPYCDNEVLPKKCSTCGCLSGQLCNLTSQTCYTSLNLTCSDGTPYGNCSTTKPLYCSNGTLINNCQKCGCLSNQSCQADGSCITIVKPVLNMTFECNAKDYSEYGNDGIIYGASFVNGKIGSALNFDGVDDYVKVPYTNSLATDNEMTVETWVKFNSVSNGRFVTKSYYRGWLLGYNNNKFYFGGYVLGDTWRYAEYSTTPTINTWYHVVGSLKDNVLKIYIDGVKKAEYNTTAGFEPEAYQIEIANSIRWGDPFNGSIDEVKVYPYALSLEQISAHYQSEINKIGNLTCKCSDNTLYNSCSTIKPYFCINGLLTPNCNSCGCPNNQFCNITSQICSNITCTDSDGLDYYTKGAVIFSNGTTTNDRCNSQIWLTEYQCINNSFFSEYYICPNGCSNGACINVTAPLNLTCSDGTLNLGCSTTKPLFCNNGTLINNCNSCGCPTNQSCQTDGSCMIVQVVSNFSDGSAEKNITINSTAPNQTVYVEVPSGANITNATIAVTTDIPNASLSVGSEPSIPLPPNDTALDILPEINGYIANSSSPETPPAGQIIFTNSGKILIPLVFHAEYPGTIRVSSIKITYLIEPSLLKESSPAERNLSSIKQMFIGMVIIGVILTVYVWKLKNKRRK
jgi:hypothetical protein